MRLGGWSGKKERKKKKKKKKEVLDRDADRTRMAPLEIPEVQAMTTTDLRRFLFVGILGLDLV